MSSTPLLDALIANLYHAAKDHKPAEIGGGIYTPDECSQLRATLLEHLALLAHFTNEAKPKTPTQRTGRPPRTIECCGCDAVAVGIAKSRTMGWSIPKWGRNGFGVCPACDRADAMRRRQSQ